MTGKDNRYNGGSSDVSIERVIFFFQAEDGIRDFCLSRGLGDVYRGQALAHALARHSVCHLAHLLPLALPHALAHALPRHSVCHLAHLLPLALPHALACSQV